MALAQYGTLITTIGLAQIANAQITQTKVGLEYIALGDGNGAHYVPTQNQTALVHEVWRGPIAELSIDPINSNRIIVDAVIPVTAGGFTIREIGIFDDKNQLIAIGQYPEKYKPQLSEGVSEETIIHFVIETNNADVVKLSIDPTVIIATRPYVDSKVGQVQKELTEQTEQLAEIKQTTVNHINDNTKHLQAGERDKWNEASISAGKIQDASTTQKGMVQLIDSYQNASTTLAPTANALAAVFARIIDTHLRLGQNATVTGWAGVAIGANAKASNNGIAIGVNCEAYDGSIAVGRGTKAYTGADSIISAAFGIGAEASNAGFALGNRGVSNNKGIGVLGGANNVDGTTYHWNIPGSLSVSGQKNFEIPHPHPDKKHTHVIRHGAVESPTAGDTLYRYDVEATKDGETVEIQLPDYFEYLNTNIGVWVNPDEHFGRAFGKVIGDKLLVTCEKAGTYKALVIGTRNDENVQDWYIRGVEREIGESWQGETFVIEVDEMTEVTEFEEVL